MPPSPYFSPTQAAAYLGLSPSTLSRWRVKGCGPSHRKFGSTVHYAIADLDLYAKRATVNHSGADDE